MRKSQLIGLAIFGLYTTPVYADAPEEVEAVDLESEAEAEDESVDLQAENASLQSSAAIFLGYLDRDLQAENASLQSSLDELTAQLEEAATMASTSAQAEALLQGVTNLIDPEIAVTSRIEAAAALRDGGDARSTPFLRSAMWDRELSVRVAALGAFEGFPGDELLAAGGVGLRKGDLTEVQAAINLLVEYHTDESAEVLWEATGAPDISRGSRSLIRSSLEEHYSDWLVARGGAQDVSSRAGTIVASITNGVVGSIALSTVGSWGQSDAAEGIGYVGGFVVGAGATWLEAQEDPITLGQGLFHAATTGAGLLLSSDLNGMLHGDEGAPETLARIYTLAGAVGGAALGWQGRGRFIEPADVGEAVFVSAMTRFAAINLADTLGIDNSNVLSAGAMASSVGGLALGRHLSSRWEVGTADPLLGLLGWTEGMFLGEVINENLMNRVENGWFEGNFAFAGLAGGLVYSHFEKPTVNEAVDIGFATGMGHMLGYGLSELTTMGSFEDELILGGGLTAMLAAIQFDTTTSESYISWVPVAADIAIATYNSAMLVLWLDLKDALGETFTGREEGIIVSTMALSGLQAQFNKPWTGPDTGRSLLLLSANAWGSYYAAMGIALGGDPLFESVGEDLILFPVLLGDAAMGFAMWASGPGGLFTPEETTVPQLGAVTGVTLGALTALMLADEPEALAIGSMVGGAAGAYAGVRLADRFRPALEEATARINLPDLPGVWVPTISPTIMEDGSVGGHVGITAIGW